METTLTIANRMALYKLLPTSGFDYSTGLIIKDLKSKTDITKEEMDQIKFIQLPAGDGKVAYQWNQEEADKIVIEVGFSKPELALLKSNLKKLNDDKQLDENLMDIYEKFML
jgi:hypothetical protein